MAMKLDRINKALNDLAHKLTVATADVYALLNVVNDTEGKLKSIVDDKYKPKFVLDEPDEPDLEGTEERTSDLVRYKHMSINFDRQFSERGAVRRVNAERRDEHRGESMTLRKIKRSGMGYEINGTRARNRRKVYGERRRDQ